MKKQNKKSFFVRAWKHGRPKRIYFNYNYSLLSKQQKKLLTALEKVSALIDICMEEIMDNPEKLKNYRKENGK